MADRAHVVAGPLERRRQRRMATRLILDHEDQSTGGFVDEHVLVGWPGTGRDSSRTKVPVDAGGPGTRDSGPLKPVAGDTAPVPGSASSHGRTGGAVACLYRSGSSCLAPATRSSPARDAGDRSTSKSVPCHRTVTSPSSNSRCTVGVMDNPFVTLSGPWSPTGRMCAASRSRVARPSGSDPTVSPVTAHLKSYADITWRRNLASRTTASTTRLVRSATSSPLSSFDP